MNRYDILRLRPEIVRLAQDALTDETAMDVWIDLLLERGELQPIVIDHARRQAFERVYGQGIFEAQERSIHRETAIKLSRRIIRELAR